MPPYHDIYVLAPERSAAQAERFLNIFAPEREQSAANYEFPRSAEQPAVVLNSAADASRYCEVQANANQAFYFKNLGPGPAYAMLFFTEDGGLILGVSVEGDADVWFERLVDSVRSNIGYITFESPPALTAAEFRLVVNRLRRQ